MNRYRMVGICALLTLFAVACSGDDGSCGSGPQSMTPAAPADPLQCCMLRTIAMHCSTGASSQSLLQSASQWRQVGESKNAEACKQLIDSEDIGCVGAGLDYGETEAAVACS